MPRKRDPNKPILTREQISQRSREASHARKIERYERMESDIRSGVQTKIIAEKYGVSIRMVERARKHFNLHKPARRIPAEDYEKALLFLQDGCSYKDVSRTCGISVEALRHKFPGYGWGKSSTQSGQFGAIMKKMHRLDSHPWEKFNSFKSRKAS